jgi:hypothetical protein
MTTRQELYDFLIQWENDPTWVEDILDAYANEVVRQVAVMMRRDWNDGHFAIHETDGAAEATEYLLSVVFGYGTPTRGLPYLSRDRWAEAGEE